MQRPVRRTAGRPDTAASSETVLPELSDTVRGYLSLIRMTRRFGISTLLAVTCSAVCMTASGANMAEQITERQVVDFLNRFETAQNTEDFDKVTPLLHPNPLFRFNDGDFRGLEAARGAFENTWAHDVEDERYFLSDIEVIHADNSFATATFLFHWSGVTENGPFEVVGRGTSVIVRHEGELRLLVEHLSR